MRNNVKIAGMLIIVGVMLVLIVDPAIVTILIIFIPAIIRIIPIELWAVIIFGWICEIALIILKR